ncbi:MAG TPA: hypothetical protein VNW06_06960, partial [Cytophagaceae bacterium]|nr:hypothetical protein [Cytophagaceae bacterium]
MTFFYKVLRAEQDEHHSVLLFLLLGLLIGGAIALTEIYTASMFIKSQKAVDFPMAFLLLGLTGITITHFYIKLQNWISLSVLAICIVTFLLIVNLSILYAHHIYSNTTTFYIAFVFSSANCILPFQLFWGFFQKIYNPLQQKRLSLTIETGLIAGTIIALSLVFYFINEKNIALEYFYLYTSILIVLAGIVVIIFSFSNTSINKVDNNVLHINAHNNYTNLIRQPYLRSILNYAFLSGLSLGLVDFLFYSIVSDRYETIYETINYLSVFFMVLTLLGYFTALLFSTKINNQYGNNVSLLLLPYSLLMFVLLYKYISLSFECTIEDDNFYLLFIIAACCKIIYSILYKGFEFNTFRKYFIPVDIELRYDFQNKAEFFIRQFGRLITGVFALIIVFFFGRPFSDLASVLILAIILWLIATYKLNKRYYTTLQNSLKTEDDQIREKQEHLSYPDELAYKINQLELSKLSIHLSILTILNTVKYKKVINKFLLSENDGIQYIALCEIEKLCMLESITLLETIQKSKKYLISKNRTAIRNTYIKLKEAESRLKKVKYIEQLALSKIISERRFGALLVAYSDNTRKINLLNKLIQDDDYQTRCNAIKASSKSTNPQIYKNLIQKLSEQQYSNTALAAIIETGEEIFPYLETAFFLTGQEERIQKIIIKIYERSENKKAIILLSKKLNYPNQNIISLVIDALSRCNTTIKGENAILFRRTLEEYCETIVWNMSAYVHLNHQNASTILLSAINAEIENNYTSLFKLLSLLYNSSSVSRIKENIDSVNSNRKEFAIQLLEALITEELKSILLPILSKDSYETTILKMEEYFPLAPRNYIEILYDLIQRDYKWVNRWTKVCALTELATSEKYINTELFIANLMNPDELIQEISAVILYKID